MSMANIDNFKESLRMLRWANVINNNDANLCFDNFWNDFSLLYDLHFPLRKVKFNVNYHKIKSYMTTGLLTSRRKKLDLQKKALLNPDMYSVMYRNYRNMYNSVLRASKKLHIDSNFNKFQKNPNKTWDLLKEMTFGVKNSQQISEICKDGQPITDKKQIAKEFNEFFATILAKKSRIMFHRLTKTRLTLLMIITLLNLNLTLTFQDLSMYVISLNLLSVNLVRISMALVRNY
jgi:hypothetical protein